MKTAVDYAYPRIQAGDPNYRLEAVWYEIEGTRPIFKGNQLSEGYIIRLLKEETKMEKELPRASIVICTRNRGSSLVRTVETILANQHPSFEVIVVDQSTNDETKMAVLPFRSDSRVRYIQSETVGTGRARNIGLFASLGEFVAYTDDDCVVPAGWIQAIDDAFRIHHRIAVLYCKVVAPASARKDGHTPVFIFHEERVICTIEECKLGLGMGAGMAVRRAPVCEIGGFDQMFGPGSRFQSGEDYEIGLRVLLNGWEIYENPEIEVVHLGFRTFDEYRKVAKRDWFALGGVFAKYLKCLYFPILPLAFHDGFLRGFLRPLAKILQFQKPEGIRNFFFVCEGFWSGLFSPVDRNRILYLDV
jgi:glycosyltransferase involved in cell wall biosynthesis